MKYLTNVVLIITILASCKNDVSTNSSVPFGLTGKSFIDTYENFAVRVDYLTDSTLQWQSVNSDNSGDIHTEQYEIHNIADSIFFIAWLEEDSTLISKVLNYQKGEISTISSSNGNFAKLKGKSTEIK